MIDGLYFGRGRVTSFTTYACSFHVTICLVSTMTGRRRRSHLHDRLITLLSLLQCFEREAMRESGREGESCCQYTAPNTLLPTHCSQHTAPNTLLPTHCSQHTAPNTLLPTHCSQYIAPNTLLQTHCSKLTAPNTLLPTHRSQQTAPNTLLPTHRSQQTAPNTLLQIHCSQHTAPNTLLPTHCSNSREGKVKFLYCAVSNRQHCSKRFTRYSLADLFNQTPSRLLWEVSCHAAINAQRLFVCKHSPLSQGTHFNT